MDDKYFMEAALDCARLALSNDEIPVGAVIVQDNKIIGSGYNSCISSNDPSAHAEIMAIRAACKTNGNYRLTTASIYVTLEPCLMCVGAIIHSRLKRLVFGTTDPKTGSVISKINVNNLGFTNHKPEVVSDILGKECGDLLRDFFRNKRNKQKDKQERN